MNNISPLEYTSTVKEEFKDDYFVDDKVLVSETIITAGNAPLQNHISHNVIKQYEILAGLDNIKTEELLSQVENNTTNDNVKIEKGTTVNEIKTEFDNGLLFCEDCHVYYLDYCMKCEMLLHILNKNTLDKADNVTQDGLPKDILEIGDSFGIFALRVIPKDVKFGPFTGLSISESKWVLKEGKFIVCEDKLKYLNWMKYVNPARSISEENLLPLQSDGNLYYQSTRQIHEGEELLVYFGEEYEENLNKIVEVNFIPIAEQDVKDVFACTFCCLGFSSRSYLTKHKTICRNNADGKFSIEELMQCPFCNFYLDEQEYYEYHRAYCSERNVRKSILLKPDNHTIEVKTDRAQRLQMYKCAHCKYKTSCKSDLKGHANQHCEMKQYKCEICCERFKTRKYLKMHVNKIHIPVEGKQTRKYLSEYKRTKKIRPVKVSPSFDCNCAICEYSTNNRSNFERHLKTKHLKEFDYNCDICNYKTNQKSRLDIHIKTIHLKEFDYNCEICNYKTNKKAVLEMHRKSKHFKEFDYNCQMCDFQTNLRSNLHIHKKMKHLKEFNYNCDVCDYKTNTRTTLEIHQKTKHLKEYDYSCEICHYKTNVRSNLKKHIRTKHLQEFYYKCEICDYKTNQKSNLEIHLKTKHLKEFKYNCETCDFKTNIKSDLEKHIKSKHLKEFDYNCDICDYRTNKRSNLESHQKTKHLSEFNYNCETCDYKANLRSHLEIHIKTKHLKEFDYNCEVCDYKTNDRSNFEKHKRTKHFK